MTDGSMQLAALDPLSPEELLAELAKSSIIGGLPISPSHLRRVGRALFIAWWPKVQELICPYIQTLNDPKVDPLVRDAAALVDILGALSGQIPVATVATLIAKYAADAFCAKGPEQLLPK